MQIGDSIYVPVSVVIPCYRCSATIDRALNSIAQQTCLPREVILVDDGSPDNGSTLTSLAMAEKNYKDKFLVRILKLEANQGAATARNSGWQAVTQPYIAFLDADDAWHKRKLEYQYDYMQKNPEVALSGHGHTIGECSAEDAPDISGPIQTSLVKLTKLLISNQFATPSVMVKTNIPLRFRVGQRYVEDHLLWLEIVLAGFKAAKLDAPLALIYKEMYGESGLSSYLWEMEKAELGNYWGLYQGRRIGLMAVLFLLPFSLAKYLRRLCIVSARRWFL